MVCIDSSMVSQRISPTSQCFSLQWLWMTSLWHCYGLLCSFDFVAMVLVLQWLPLLLCFAMVLVGFSILLQWFPLLVPKLAQSFSLICSQALQWYSSIFHGFHWFPVLFQWRCLLFGFPSLRQWHCLLYRWSCNGLHWFINGFQWLSWIFQWSCNGFQAFSIVRMVFTAFSKVLQWFVRIFQSLAIVGWKGFPIALEWFAMTVQWFTMIRIAFSMALRLFSLSCPMFGNCFEWVFNVFAIDFADFPMALQWFSLIVRWSAMVFIVFHYVRRALHGFYKCESPHKHNVGPTARCAPVAFL